MAVTFEDFKKQFQAIEKSVLKYKEEIDNNERYMGQTTGVIKAGTREVGLRVQELKDNGMTGNTIQAFMGDGEIKTMMASIQQYLAGMQKELVKIAGMYGAKQKTVADFGKLKVAVTAEIAARKKEVSTKLGTGNKSLPDMEKLLAEMKKYEGEMTYAKVEVFVPEKYDDHLKETNGAIAKQVTQSKDVALSALQKEMQEQAMNTRTLNGNVGRAKGWYDTVMKQCAEAQKALKAKQSKELLAAKVGFVKPWKDLQEMNAMYQDGMKDQWIASQLRTSKDKSKVEAGVKQILDMKTKAGVEVGKIANAKV
jgi:predicted  nucleic acid-binding Zn-ribbon protein